MRKEEAQELLKKYCLGQCTKREAAIVDQWYRSLGKNGAIIPDEVALGQVKEEMWSNIQKDTAREGRMRRLPPDKGSRGKKWFDFPNLKRVAALLLIGMTLAFFFYYQKKQEWLMKSAVSVQEKPSAASMPSIIYLADGSIVKLTAGSRLQYPDVFTGTSREVTLVGEAFFEVAPDAEKPFIIHSGDLITKVLGTSFSIRAYENSDSTEVAVVTGKVSVFVADSSKVKGEMLVLEPNQKAVYSRKRESFVQTEEKKQTVRNDLVTRPNLVFNETSLGEIIKVMNKYYGIQIILENEKMSNCLITAALTNEPVELSLKIITKAIGAAYEIKGEKIILKGKGCPEHGQ